MLILWPPCPSENSPGAVVLQVRHQEVHISVPEVSSIRRRQPRGPPKLPHGAVLQLEVLTV
ncbi:hypothetical protein P7K49_016593, partial [Saguinus oedipus]